MQPIFAVQCVAAGAGNAAIAGARPVLEIGAAVALHQVAAERGGIAQLRRCAGKQRFGHRRKGARKAGVIGEIGIAHQRADAHRPILQPVDTVEAGQAGNIDEPFRPRDADLHQVDEIGAAGEIGGAELAALGNGLSQACGSEEIEAVHAASLPVSAVISRCAWSTASVMPL